MSTLRFFFSVVAWFVILSFNIALAENFTVYSGNLPPFNYQDADGKPAGICYDTILEKYLGKIGPLQVQAP